MTRDIKRWIMSQFEPRVAGTRWWGISNPAQASMAISLQRIAISLQRIATALEALQQNHQLELKLPDSLHGDLTNIAWEAGRSFQAGTRTDR